MDGHQIGPYEVIERIAKGGMAEIFLARQRAIEGLTRTVVLKRILPEFSNHAEFVTMFLDEARLMAELAHPNIVQTLDLGKADDSYYLVMEYVRGPTVAELIRSLPKVGLRGLPLKEALAIVRAVAEALAYVHGRQDEFGRPLNIIHRDLNPSNVIVSYDGAVKLIDFGIAKAASQVHQTRTEVVKGTYGYIAPEQFRHEPIDHRADVFGLGVMLYELCLGCHPFDAGSLFTVIRNVVRGEYKRPRMVDGEFPRDLGNLITACLEVEPNHRPEGTHVVVHEIANYMASRGMVVTMGDLSYLAQKLVTDVRGPSAFRPLTSESVAFRLPFAQEATAELAIKGNDEASPAAPSAVPPSLGVGESRRPSRPAHAAAGHAASAWSSAAAVDQSEAPTKARSRPSTGRTPLAAPTYDRRPSDAGRPESAFPSERARISDHAFAKTIGSDDPAATPILSRHASPKSALGTHRFRLTVGVAIAVALSAAAVGIFIWQAKGDAPSPYLEHATVGTVETDGGAVSRDADFNDNGSRDAGSQPREARKGAARTSDRAAEQAEATEVLPIKSASDFPLAQEQRVRLASKPAGAMVSIGGRIVGKAPLDVAVPADREGVIVTLRLAGYKTVERLIHESEQDVTVELTSRRRRRRRRQR